MALAGKPVPLAHFVRKRDVLIASLKEACDRYDGGQFDIALRIASDLAVLILDKRRKNGAIRRDGMSLLRRMGQYPVHILDRSMQCLLEVAKGLHGPVCTIGLRRDYSFGFFPVLDGFPERAGKIPPLLVPAEVWWDTPILRDRYGRFFSRRELLETYRDRIANHNDDKWPAEFIGLSFEGSTATIVSGPIVRWGDEDTFRLAMRQMAHEVLSVTAPAYGPVFTSVPAGECELVSFLEIQEQVEPGVWVTLTEPGAAEVHIETTACEQTAAKWYENTVTVPSGSADRQEIWQSATYGTGVDPRETLRSVGDRVQRIHHFCVSPVRRTIAQARIGSLAQAPSYAEMLISPSILNEP